MLPKSIVGLTAASFMDRNCDNNTAIRLGEICEMMDDLFAFCESPDVGDHLDLSLEGLDVVDNLVEHPSLPRDLAASRHQVLEDLHPLAYLLPPHLHQTPPPGI